MSTTSKWLIAIITTILIAAGSIYWYIHSTVSEYQNAFYPNVVIEGVNLSKLTKEDGQNQLASIIDQYNQINVTITAGDQVFQKQLQDIGVQYNLEKQIEEAFQFGKNESLLEQFKLIKDQKGQSYTLSYSIDETLLNNWVTEIEQSMDINPIDAEIKIRNGQVSITNDIKGLRIDQEQLKIALMDALNTNQKQDITVNAILEEIPARITSDTLNNVRHVIGTFTTYYSSDQTNRNLNIKIATEIIDSYLLMPGETFSFNDFVGDTTADKGYKPAGSYLNGEVVDSYGGGVCQVSTTLYNAIIKAGIVPDVRYNHSMTVGYVPIGQDAAIAYPYKDLAFTNPYTTPVYIEGTVGPSSVTFTVYSTTDSKEANTDFRLSSEIVSNDTEKIKSVTYLEKLSNGTVVERKVISNDTYKQH
ncbi:MAG: VanW family protein, partial [Lysinibacillus sp.]